MGFFFFFNILSLHFAYCFLYYHASMVYCLHVFFPGSYIMLLSNFNFPTFSISQDLTSIRTPGQKYYSQWKYTAKWYFPKILSLENQEKCKVIYVKKNLLYLTVNILIRNAYGPYVNTAFQCLSRETTVSTRI